MSSNTLQLIGKRFKGITAREMVTMDRGGNYGIAGYKTPANKWQRL